MIPSPSSWPFARPEQLADALREQGATPTEIAEMLPAVQRLAEVPSPQPSLADTQRLLARLMPALPGFSPVRQAIRAHRHHDGRFSGLLATAHTQVSLFGLAFWLVSALITLLGAVAVTTTSALSAQETLLRASGPLLAYLGTVVAFRGVPGRMLELELVCLPTPVQLTIARLVLVLSFDLGLGLLLGLALWVNGPGHFFTLLLSWFMPLLLVAGLALVLSLRFPMQTAASLAYGSWLVILVFNATSLLPVLALTPFTDTLIGAGGLAMLALAVVRLHANAHRLLPRS